MKKIKRVIRYFLLLTILFILPIFVSADETKTFSYIDIDPSVNLIYNSSGNKFQQNLYTDNQSLSGLSLYRIKEDNSQEEIPITGSWIDDSNGNKIYRITGTFNINNTDNSEVKYKLVYTYKPNSTDEVTYESEYTYSSNNNLSTHENGEGLKIKIFNSPSIRIEKKLTEGTPDGTFTFNVTPTGGTALQVTITTKNGIGFYIMEDLPVNTSYTIEETNIPSTYSFVSIENESETNTENATTTITTGDLNSVKKVTITNSSKVDHNKTLKDNEDGTYQLSLDVTGRVETIPAKANVVVVIDTSYSMSTVTNTAGYVPTNSNTNQNYYRLTEDGQYVRVYRQSTGGYNPTYYYTLTNNPNGERYTGIRYIYRNNGMTRMEAAKAAAVKLARSLYSNNTDENNDIIEMALITFATQAQTHLSDSENSTASLSFDEFTNAVIGLSPLGGNGSVIGGTNWEAALQLVNSISFGDSDPTYVIFVSDGNPTFRNTQGGYSNTYYYQSGWNYVQATDNAYYNDYTVYGTGTEIAENIRRAYEQAKNDAKALVDNEYEFYTIGYSIGTFENVDRMKSLTTDSGEELSHYFKADSTEQLNEAFDAILNEINQSGIGQVTIADGTTQSVKKVSGEVSHLLTVDTNSFEYWLTFPIESNGKIKIDNKEITFTKNTDGTYKFTWVEGESTKTATVTGYCDDNAECTSTSKTFNYKWTNATEFYNKAPTAATLNSSGQVDWSLSSVGLLLDKVKYSVKFNVWPSQYTYDLIADLKNGVISYDELDKNIKNYLINTGNGYTLYTNTEAKLVYDDSSQGTTGEEIAYVNPIPVGTDASQVTVKKEWQNAFADRDVDSVTLKLTENGTENGASVTLSSSTDPKWSGNIYLSVGLMSLSYDSNNNPIATIRENGYDYSFKEYFLNSYNNQLEQGYHWDLVVDTMHPMSINGTLTMLIETELPENISQSDTNKFNTNNAVIIGNVTYYKICNENNKCSVYKANDTNTIITAWNYRRSNLNLTKNVVGNAPADTIYNFTLTVKSSDGEDLWFSISTNPDDDTTIIKGNTYTLSDGTTTFTLVNSITPSSDGYYRFASNGTVTVHMLKNWNLRITNLPVDSTYTFTELQLLDNFILDKVEVISQVGKSNETTTVTESNNATISGTITDSNTKYTVIYTNRYMLTEVTVVKEWVDSNGDSITTNIPENITVVISASDGRTIQNATVTLSSENSWTHTWNNLTKFVSTGANTYSTITYTVTEIKVGTTTLSEDGIYSVYDNNNAVIAKWHSSIKCEENDTNCNTGTNYTITNTYEEMPYTTLSFIKVKFNTREGLSGAVFVLYRYKPLEGDSSKVEFDSTNSDVWAFIESATSTTTGLVSFNERLYEGEYRLIETVAPVGYILPSGQWILKVTPDNEEPIEFSTTDTFETPGVEKDPISKTLYIPNQEIPEIPTTGGRGIVDYSIFGFLMMILGAYFLIINQRNLITNKY